jgi:hypothetical protein
MSPDGPPDSISIFLPQCPLFLAHLVSNVSLKVGSFYVLPIVSGLSLCYLLVFIIRNSARIHVSEYCVLNLFFGVRVSLYHDWPRIHYAAHSGLEHGDPLSSVF